MSEDGTTVAVPHSDGPQTAANGSNAESNSDRDPEVDEASRRLILLFPLQLKAVFCFYPVARSAALSQRQPGAGCQA